MTKKNTRIEGKVSTQESLDKLEEQLTGSILVEAETIVNGERQQDYGNAQESFEKIAFVASYLGDISFTPVDIVNALIAVKLVRHSYKPQRDNLVDLAGYTKIKAILQGLENEKDN